QFGKAFISLGAFADELDYSREHICRSVSELVKKGLLRKTGEKKYGHLPCVEILPLPELSHDEAQLTKISTIVDKNINDHCQKNQTSKINIENIKEQKPESFVDVFLFKKLHSFGV